MIIIWNIYSDWKESDFLIDVYVYIIVLLVIFIVCLIIVVIYCKGKKKCEYL